MGMILRSSQYARFLNVFARRIVAGHDNADCGRKLVVLQARCINPCLAKSYATLPTVKRKNALGTRDPRIVKYEIHFRNVGQAYKDQVAAVLAKWKMGNKDSITSESGLLLIRSCGERMVDAVPAIRSGLVQEIWDILEQQGNLIDVTHFNALLRVYLENDYEFSPMKILTKMANKSIEPDEVTYQRLIMYHCKKGDIEGASKMLGLMKEKGLALNTSIFNALITGHCKANDMESAKNILNVMKNAGVAPSAKTYTALMCGHAKTGDIASIKELINEGESKMVYFTNKDLFEVIQVLLENGHDSAMDEILSLMPGGPNYNDDVCLAAVKALDVGNLDVALKIVATMRKQPSRSDETERAREGFGCGDIVIRKLVNSKFPLEKIIEACEQLEKMGEGNKPYAVALERCIFNADTTLALPLMKICKDRVTIREHYLRPFLAAHGKALNYQGVGEVIRFMTSELKLVPGMDTVADFVLPYMSKNWNKTIATLQEAYIPYKIINNAMVSRLLSTNKIGQTLNFMLVYKSEYDARNIIRLLPRALSRTDDVRSFVMILRVLHHYSAGLPPASNIEEEGSTGESQNIVSVNVFDAAVSEVFTSSSYTKRDTLEKVLDGLIEGGCSISPEVGEKIIQYFGDDITPEISENVAKLTSGTLELKPLFDNNTDNLVDETSAISVQDVSYYNRLLDAISSRDAKTLQSVAEEMEANNFHFKPRRLVSIIDTFCTAEDLEQAEKWIKKLRSESPEYSLGYAALNYALLLIKKGRFEDALEVISEEPIRYDMKDLDMQQNRAEVMRLLDLVSTTSNVENTIKLVDTLMKYKYSKQDDNLHTRVLDMYIRRGDSEGAFEVLQHVHKHYGRLPRKNEVTKMLIKAEDATSLQRLIDLSTQDSGETNSVMDLTMSFIECGRLRQARRILETPGLKLSGPKLRFLVSFYTEDSRKEKALQQLIDITKDLPVINRRELYKVLVDAYSKRNNHQRGLELWSAIQEENLQPSQYFLNTLAALLRKNNKPVPFISEWDKHAEQATLSNIDQCHEALQQGDLEKAERMFASMHMYDSDMPMEKSSQVKFKEVASKLIHAILTQREDVGKAHEIAHRMAKRSLSSVSVETLNSVWVALIEARKFDEFRSYDNIVKASENKRELKKTYAKLLSRVNILEQGVVPYLTQLETQMGSSERSRRKAGNIDFKTLRDAIKENPSLVHDITPLAEKMADRRSYGLLYLLWSYYLEENKPEADEIWNKHLVGVRTSPRVYNYIIRRFESLDKVECLERLYQMVQSSDTSSKTKVRILMSLVDMYNRKECYDDALRLLSGDLSPAAEDIIRTEYKDSIQNLKQRLEANGKDLPQRVIGYQ